MALLVLLWFSLFVRSSGTSAAVSVAFPVEETQTADVLERLLFRQEVQMAQLKETVSILSDRIATLEAENERLKQRTSLQEAGKDEGNADAIAMCEELKDAVLALSEKVRRIEKKQKVKFVTPSVSSAHDKTVRSDDAGSLEPLLSQLSQRLTEVSAQAEANKAEMQTLKNTHAADIQQLHSVDQQHTQAIQEAAGSVYTHWGSSSCHHSSSLVYSGVVGGSWYEHGGAATNYLCLTMSPVLQSNTRSGDYNAQVYGTEYLTSDSHVATDAVCAVCQSPRSKIVMVPGTNHCWSGWTTEYTGYLMAGEHSYSAGSEYICVDSAMQSGSGSSGYQNGAYLAFVRTFCGYSLPCPPYVDNKIPTCAVCSK